MWAKLKATALGSEDAHRRSLTVPGGSPGPEPLRGGISRGVTGGPGKKVSDWWATPLGGGGGGRGGEGCWCSGLTQSSTDTLNANLDPDLPNQQTGS